jgi:hypothetical protein
MSADDPGPDVQRSHVAIEVLVRVIRRHIERLRTKEIAQSRSAGFLRQYRDYGYGLIGALSAYCDEVGVTCPACVELALELQEAIADATERGNGMDSTTRGPAGVRRALQKRVARTHDRS